VHAAPQPHVDPVGEEVHRVVAAAAAAGILHVGGGGLAAGILRVGGGGRRPAASAWGFLGAACFAGAGWGGREEARAEQRCSFAGRLRFVWAPGRGGFEGDGKSVAARGTFTDWWGRSQPRRPAGVAAGDMWAHVERQFGARVARASGTLPRHQRRPCWLAPPRRCLDKGIDGPCEFSYPRFLGEL
jgi:hypothetical protein